MGPQRPTLLRARARRGWADSGCLPGSIFTERKHLVFDIAVFELGAIGKVELARVFNRAHWTLYCDTRKVAWGDSERLLGSESFVEAKSNNRNLVILISDTEVIIFQMQWFAW